MGMIEFWSIHYHTLPAGKINYFVNKKGVVITTPVWFTKTYISLITQKQIR